jgi:hypothetical protein
MARMPGAEWLGEHSPQTPMTRWDVVCCHTIVGYAPAHAAHFSVRGNGKIQQSRDTAFRSGANLEGNHRVIAIENEDHGPEFGIWNGSNVPPLTPAQIQANAEILAWAHLEHGIPLQICTDSRPESRGLAYHRQGIDGNFGGFRYSGRVTGGEKWSTSFGKVCPGDNRIDQLPLILARARQIVRDARTDLVGVNAGWHMPREKRRALIREAADYGVLIAGVEGKWLNVGRILGEGWTVTQGEGDAKSGCFLALATGVEYGEAHWTVGTTNEMAGRLSAKMETRWILEQDVLLEGQWRTVMVAHFPPKRYFWLYARMLRNLRRRMSEANHPVLVFADWNRYAAAVAAGTGLNVRHREVVGWAFTPGQSISPARRVDVGGDHPGIAITVREN